MTKVQFLLYKDSIIGYVAYNHERFLFFPRKWPATTVSIQHLKNLFVAHNRLPEYIGKIKVQDPVMEEIPLLYFEHYGDKYTFASGFPPWVAKAKVSEVPPRESHFFIPYIYD